MLKMSSNSLQTFVKLKFGLWKTIGKKQFFFKFRTFLFFCKYLTKILTFPNSNKFKKQDFYNNNNNNNIITKNFFSCTLIGYSS